MTVNGAGSAYSTYSASFFQSTSSNSSTSSSSSVSSTELSEEEKLYDTDGDGVLSVQELAAYTQAQAAKKTTSAMNDNSQISSEDREKRTLENLQQMQHGSSLTQINLMGKLQKANETDGTEEIPAENSENESKSIISAVNQRAIDVYQALQSMNGGGDSILNIIA